MTVDLAGEGNVDPGFKPGPSVIPVPVKAACVRLVIVESAADPFGMASPAGLARSSMSSPFHIINVAQTAWSRRALADLRGCQHGDEPTDKNALHPKQSEVSGG